MDNKYAFTVDTIPWSGMAGESSDFNNMELWETEMQKHSPNNKQHKKSFSADRRPSLFTAQIKGLRNSKQNETSPLSRWQ